jgi:hypothetical protein
MLLLIVRQFQPKYLKNQLDSVVSILTHVDIELYLNLLIITYNSIKILYESRIFSILKGEWKVFWLSE